ncbi:uncharacterized protein [Littorina saxatilis]|uniref:uncharacterized protein isoform X1 n=2 Tax=Littorina saxatilis TaxID=31220 RepID=UPI0038B5EB25
MRSVSFSAAVKPLFFVLCVCGVYSPPFRCSKKWWYILAKILSVLVETLCCGSLVVSLVGQIIMTLSLGITVLYNVSFTLGEIVLLVTFHCFCRKSFRVFFEEFEAYQKEHCRRDAKYKGVFILGIVNVFLVVVSLCSAFYWASLPFSIAQCQLGYLELPELFGKIMCHPVAYGIVIFFSTHVYGAVFFLYLTIWKALKTEANDIVEKFTKIDKLTLRETPEVIENFRLRHADLCHVINAANRFMTHILAAFYGAGITCMLLLIHGMISQGYGVSYLIDLGQLFFIFVFYLITITLTGVSLNLKMHEPVDFLFRLDVHRMTGTGSDIVSMFLSRVQGAPIGFHVYHLFTVDTSTVMMICGTLLTYALVIVQFQPVATVQQSASSSTEQPMMSSSTYAEHSERFNNTPF